ncbi:GNAT family N-acetyltransferase [Janibacter terrae]|uniref:GNAT family N-acetyltransferase n=1 Tax=Janibacter terrae TaxID=103817 RepID=A0ABZ2FCE9_9MICO|nr:GNAT family N-acetyltransferase [Janibacter terrae]
MTADLAIRPATDDDWSSIYPFWSRIVAQGHSYTYPTGLDEDEARPWWMEEAPGRTVVAVDGPSVLGSAKMGPNKPGRGAHIATASFMVDPDCRVRGVGRALGEDMIAWARTEGYDGIQFNAVVETNERAVGLWRSLGFDVVGTVPGAFMHPEHGPVGLHVMFLDLRVGTSRPS